MAIKSQNMKISGYVMVRDPKDQETIRTLKIQLNAQKSLNRLLEKEVSDLKKTNSVLKKTEYTFMRLQDELKAFAADLNNWGKRSVRETLYNFPDRYSVLMNLQSKLKNKEQNK